MLIDFKAWHLMALDPLGLRERDSVTWDNAAIFERVGGWVTYCVAGRPIACAGYLKNDKGLWLSSYLTRESARHMLALHRVGQALLASASEPVLSATQPEFRAGCRWLAMLGFKPIGPLSALYPEMNNAVLYERT